MKNKENQDKNPPLGSNFFGGLLLGVAAGGVGYFLLGTKKGREIKNKLLKEGKKLWQEIEASLDKEEKQTPPEKKEQVKKSSLKLLATKVKKVKKFFIKNGKALKK